MELDIMGTKTELIPFSVGLVIDDSIDNSHYIRVIPIEQHGYIDGEITDLVKVDEVKGKDSQGNNWETSYTTTNALTAKWMSNDSNRRTPPSIHKGEKVQLYRYGDSEDIFWDDFGQDTRNRTTERQVNAWSNKPKRDSKELNSTNSYYLEVDTATGLVTLKTNKSNGEKVAYTIQVQTKKSILVIEDDLGNAFYIDSLKKEVGMENQAKSKVQLLDKDINLEALESVNIKAKNINLSATNGITGKAKTVNYQASTSYSVKTNTWSTNASSMIGTSSGSYGITSTSLTHNGVNVGGTHSHMEQGDGKPTGPPQ